MKRFANTQAMEPLHEARRRIIAETNAYLTYCLQHPEEAVRIPVVPAGKGTFPPSMSRAFWESILAEP